MFQRRLPEKAPHLGGYSARICLFFGMRKDRVGKGTFYCVSANQCERTIRRKHNHFSKDIVYIAVQTHHSSFTKLLPAIPQRFIVMPL